MTGAQPAERKVNRKDAPMLGTYDLAAATKSSGFNPSTLILILIVVVAFYFLMIRPPACGPPRACTPRSSTSTATT
jgi:hypothetical protein